MDRTGLIVIVVCLGLLIWWDYTLPKRLPAPARAPSAVTTAPAGTNAAPVSAVSGAASPAAAASASSAIPATPAAPAPEQLGFLENDFVRVTLTSRGAAVREIVLKKHAEGADGHVVLNEQARHDVLQLTGWPGAENASFQAADSSPGRIVYTTTLPNGLRWERAYTLGADYDFRVADTLMNPSGVEVTLPPYRLSAGRAEPLLVAGHYQSAANRFLGAVWLGQHFRITTVGEFNPSSFFGLIHTRDARARVTSRESESGPLRWFGVQNQFFAVVLTPEQTGSLEHAEAECYNDRDGGGAVPSEAEPDVEAFGHFPAVSVPAGGSTALGYRLYAGPKELKRLDALGQQQGELMNYGWWEPIIRPMLAVLHFAYEHLRNYGLAIIVLTLIVKAITWPLQSIANRSGKRMQALAPKIKEVQAKYKDQPEKVTVETMALYRDYGVNPFGGCLPALVQMPVFFSLYTMLQNAVELRGASFLWAHDLTQPDTIFVLPFLFFHLPINPLPLMVTGLTVLMMRMTPQIGDPQQARIAQLMPLVFLFIFYGFASALSLYYVVNNCVSILQIYRNLRKPLPELKRRTKK